MKTLKNHTILYDEVCPMCNAYTSAFVKTGMLDKDGREPYQNMSCNYASKVDTLRAVNEIALVNKETGEVEYGIRSLFIILGNSFPSSTRYRPLSILKFRAGTPAQLCRDATAKVIKAIRRFLTFLPGPSHI